MQIRGPAKGTTRVRGPASAARLSGGVRRHVLFGTVDSRKDREIEAGADAV
jgi:hypothetical protein